MPAIDDILNERKQNEEQDRLAEKIASSAKSEVSVSFPKELTSSLLSLNRRLESLQGVLNNQEKPEKVDLSGVVSAVRDLKFTMSRMNTPVMPKVEMPQFPGSLTVSNLAEVTESLMTVNNSVNELATVVKDSKTEVNIPEQDTDSLIGAVESVKHSIESMQFPIPQPTTPAFKNEDGGAVSVILGDTGNIPTLDPNLEIAKGNVLGHSFIHKFGNAPDFDTGDGSVDVWDGADDGGSDLMTYTYSSTADIDSLSSSDNGDTQDVEVQGLDTNFDLVVQTITLTGQTRVALATDLVRVFRIKNVGATDFAGTVYCFVNVATSSGVPDTLANIRAQVDDGNNQTLMAIYTIPNDKTGYLDCFYANSAGASKSTAYQVDLFARPEGQVFQLKHRSAFDDDNSSGIFKDYRVGEVFAAKTDIVVRVNALSAGVIGANISAGFDMILVDN